MEQAGQVGDVAMADAPQPVASPQQAGAAGAKEAGEGAAADQQPQEQATDNAAAAAEVPAPAQPAAPPNPLVTQYTEQWKKVTDNPTEFPAWTALISTAEKLDELERLRAVYEPFLAAYPLCYGYWKKYADAESRHQITEQALAVFERGVSATPYSMDLWGHYAAYKKANGGSPDDVRSIYERALEYCGTDYVSHTLWDKYIHYEEEHGTALHVAMLYTRVLNLPLRELNRFMQGLRGFIQSRSASDIMTPEEQSALMEQLSKVKEEQAAAAAAATTEGGEAAAPPAADTSVSDDEVKAAWLSQREAMLEAAKKAADSRRPFEEGIKRSYFHVKPLDTPQLLNWVRYLDHQEAATPQDTRACVMLYERCLVPCASYPGSTTTAFWERYVRYLESKGMSAEADSAVQRAVGVFCRTRPEAYLLAARHEERRGKADQAREHYQHVLTQLAPDLLTAVAAAANFERRQGNLEAAKAHWAGAVEREKGGGGSKVKTEEGAAAPPSTPAGSKLYPFLAMQYATFLREVCGQTDVARSVLQEAVAAAPHLRNLWEAAVHLELCAGGEGMVERATALFESACAEPPEGRQGLTEKEREELSIRYVEFADAHGDAAALLRAETAHSARFTLPSSFAAAAAAAGADTGRKRAAESPLADPAAAKAARGESVTTPHAAAASAAALPGPPPAPAAAVPPAPAAYHHYPPAAPPPAAAAYQYPPAAYGHYAGYPPAGYGYGYGY